ncbi:MAG: hypothetical protein J6J36_06175 [Clostridia bacterium]|nr:hypothetical protein [Clostridia bacterium]
MNLIDENVEKESDEKQRKLTKVIIFSIIILLLIVVVIWIYSTIKKKNTLQLKIDNKETKFSSELFLMQDKNNLVKTEDGKIYISVKGLASMLNVGFYNDEFNGGGEDVTKCYIKTDNEYTSYISNSSKIYKVTDNKAIKEEMNKDKKNAEQDSQMELLNDYEYQYFSIEDGVRYVNNEIYARSDAIELGFNVTISYDEKNKNVSILSIDGLESIAKSKVGDAAVTGEDASFNNKKLLKHGYVLIKNGTEEYGIADYWNYKQGSYFLSCKYSKIEYIESLGCLIVTASDNQKVGILKMNLEGEGSVSKVLDPRYDSITQLSEDGKFYLIKEGDRYGVIKIEEGDNGIEYSTVLKSEYKYIGIENPESYGDETTSRFILSNKYIPIKNDSGKWGLASIEGDILVVPQYDIIGCNISKVGNPVLIINDLKKGLDVVVFGNSVAVDEKTTKTTYRLIDPKTNAVVGLEAYDIYSIYEDNETLYYLNAILTSGDPMKVNIIDIYGDPNRNKQDSNNKENNKKVNANSDSDSGQDNGQTDEQQSSNNEANNGEQQNSDKQQENSNSNN